jgi:hypothetical protein
MPPQQLKETVNKRHSTNKSVMLAAKLHKAPLLMDRFQAELLNLGEWIFVSPFLIVSSIMSTLVTELKPAITSETLCMM